MSIGYGCIKHTLTTERQNHIENQLLRPVVEMMTQYYDHDFGTIHNHGLWSVAAVGTCGLVIGEDSYVVLAVDGLQGDQTTGGYLAEISQLFAPSGYYIEGPYYHRFAVRPLLIFAEALHAHRPELDIYNVSDRRIGTTIKALLSLVYPNGRLPALNDASLSMGIQDEGLLIAASVYNARYDDDHYYGVGMQRTVLLIEHELLSSPLLVDLFRLSSDTEHDYDYALQYSGQICDTTADYTPNVEQWPALGDSNGYEHLMGVAQARLTEPTRLTWLQGNRFNTWLNAADRGELIFAQLGANDPSFNLRRETTLLLRQRGKRHLFASAFETHGFFDESTERCWGARGELDEIRTLGHDDTASVIELQGKHLHLIIMVSNRPEITAVSVTDVSFNGSTYRWTGFFDCRCV